MAQSYSGMRRAAIRNAHRYGSQHIRFNAEYADHAEDRG